MHHNRSLLPNVEVLLGVMVKTSKCSNKLLFVILNFYSRLFSWFWSNFRISKFLAKFHNFMVFRIYLNGQNLNNPIMIWVRFCIFVFRISIEFVFQISPQISSLMRRCKITLVAFVCFFSTVYFEMGLQSVCKTGSKFTLTALVWLFSTVCCQMCSQMACLRGCIVTLVAFVFSFSTVHF